MLFEAVNESGWCPGNSTKLASFVGWSNCYWNSGKCSHIVQHLLCCPDLVTQTGQKLDLPQAGSMCIIALPVTAFAQVRGKSPGYCMGLSCY